MEDVVDEEELSLRAHNCTTDMMSNVGASSSLNSLTKIVGCLGDTNKDVFHHLLRSKSDNIGSREHFELLCDYFSCSQKTIGFLNTLHMCLHGVNHRVNTLNSAIKQFKSDKSNLVYVPTVLKVCLENFLKVNDSFSIEQLRAKLSAVLDEQKSLCERLQAKKHEVDHRNMARFRLYQRVTTAVLVSLYMGLLACTIAAAIISPPLAPAPLVAIAAVASMNPTEYTRKWMNSALEKYKEKINRRSELMTSLMEANSRMALDDLEGIRFVVQTLRDKIQRFSANVGPVVNVRKDSVVNDLIKDLEKKIHENVEAVRDLESKKDKCYKDLTDARAKILGTTFSFR